MKEICLNPFVHEIRSRETDASSYCKVKLRVYKLRCDRNLHRMQLSVLRQSADNILKLFFLLHRNGATGTREAVLTWPTFPLILLRLMRSILTTVPPI